MERLSGEDVEMEDLNFYYADYSRFAVPEADGAEADPAAGYTTTSLLFAKGLPTCERGVTFSFLTRKLKHRAPGPSSRSRTLSPNPSRSRSSKSSSPAPSNKPRTFPKLFQRQERSEWARALRGMVSSDIRIAA